MIHGYGAHPVSYGWIIGGGVFGRFVIGLLGIIAREL